MKTKTIIADSMPLALKMVRQQLGDNAVIVNTKSIKTGGFLGLFTKQKFQVTAYSVDNKATSSIPKLSKDIHENTNRNVPEKSFYNKKEVLNQYQNSTSQKNAPKEKTVQDQNPLLDELQHMRKMMMTFMINDNNSNTIPTSLTKWINRLKKQGVDESVVEHIVSSILKKYETPNDLDENTAKKEVYDIIKEILEKRTPKTVGIDHRTRIIKLIGPTGVGKTTSIAKMATEHVLKQKRKVAMITTDVYRIAAVEQLKTYAGILNVPIEVVRSAEELDKALIKLEHYDLIYMDTTGRNYKDVKYRESIEEFLNHPVDSDHYLVLSLTTKFEDMQMLLEEFVGSPIKKLILTKYDETTSYGSILNIAYKYPYQLAYITNGQSVPEDIITVDASLLAKNILGEEQ
jgi:flagellar biosynthesis protein FlhF